MTIARMRKIVWRKMRDRGFMGDVGVYMDALLHRWEIPQPRLYGLFMRCLFGQIPRTKHGWIARCRAWHDQFSSGRLLP